MERLWRFAGPKGIIQEIFTTPLTNAEAAAHGHQRLGDRRAGMGHVAITTRDPHGLHAYFNTVFDSRLSDFIDENVGGLNLKIRFLRVNERHHSVASPTCSSSRSTRSAPRRSTSTSRRARSTTWSPPTSGSATSASGWRGTSGQHTNDRSLSFYCVTPSGFELEMGWNPVTVGPEQEATWEPTTYQGISIWGHTPVGETVVTKLHQFANSPAQHPARRGARARADAERSDEQHRQRPTTSRWWGSAPPDSPWPTCSAGAA